MQFQHRCSPLWSECTGGSLEDSGDQLREKFCLSGVWVVQLESTPAHRAGDSVLNSGSDKNFSLKLIKYVSRFTLICKIFTYLSTQQKLFSAIYTIISVTLAVIGFVFQFIGVGTADMAGMRLCYI